MTEGATKTHETTWGLQLSAGSGPVEVRVFVGELVPRLIDELAARGLCVTCVELRGEPQAPSSATLWFPSATPPALEELLGTHEWVSPLRGRRARKRWFAGVALLAPCTAAAAPLEPNDVVVTACRSGGAGGQHVNTTSSAVQLHHIPSGIRVRAEGERSQRSNRAAAWVRLALALGARAADEEAARESHRRLAHWQVVRGAPVRRWCFSVD